MGGIVKMEIFSPFLSVPEEDRLCENSWCFAIFDSYPVSVGHVLVVTKRVVETWFDCTAEEQGALMDLVNVAKNLLEKRLNPRPDGYNVGFNAGAAAGQTVGHVHLHLIPRYHGDMGDPRGGVRHVIPEKGNYQCPQPPMSGVKLTLTTGYPDLPLWDQLAERILGATEIDLLASFVQPSGLDVIQRSIFAAIATGARVRLLVGDYLFITSAEALRRIVGWMELAGEVLDARLIEMRNLAEGTQSFHPKAWRIADSSGGIVVVGSSNLSRAALQTGLEWNLIGETSGSAVATSELHQQVETAFGELWRIGTPLSKEVVAGYLAASELARPAKSPDWGGEANDVEDGRDAETFVPWGMVPRPWQATALEALQRIRREGFTKALAAVATGMGKTSLAAFDLLAVGRTLGRCPRVLVIAHRAEILVQAEVTIRRALESVWGSVSVDWRVGFSGGLSRPLSRREDEAEEGCVAQLVVASIQKLSRAEELQLLAGERFDYCVIDEVHHAEAPSYRRVMARLDAGFTLGLTATPERTDGVDVATLFDDILVAQVTIGDGIAEESLVPFRYRGLKDDVDFEKIPWRGGRFDPAILEERLESSDRMERLWKEWEAEPAERTLVFCCSRRHAVFTRNWLRRRGVRTAAIFSEVAGGELSSDSRMGSLADFVAGKLEALCVVDLFNEGIDLPLIDRVVMLRPTDSKIIFFQQLGRGLRVAEGKTHLKVIDFVGNHRVFANRLGHLLSMGLGKEGVGLGNRWRQISDFLEGKAPVLPLGCVIDVEVEAKAMLLRLMPQKGGVVVDVYRAMRDELGRRPSPGELYSAGYLPMTVSTEHDSWLEFCRSEGDLNVEEVAVVNQWGDWFKMLQTTNLNKSYKMVVLRVLLDFDRFWVGMDMGELALACRKFLGNHPQLRDDLEGAAYKRDLMDARADEAGFIDWWRKWPIDRWLLEQSGRRWFVEEGNRLGASFKVEMPRRSAFETLSGELIDYRLAQYSRTRMGTEVEGKVSRLFVAKVSHSGGRPILFLPRVEDEFGRPIGPTVVSLPDGSEWIFRMVKVACNVAMPKGVLGGGIGEKNQLGELLRGWFGENAGVPGTNFVVEFRFEEGGWKVAPKAVGASAVGFRERGDQHGVDLVGGEDVGKEPLPFEIVDAPEVGERFVRYVPVYDLQAAAGFWGPECLPSERGWAEIAGVKVKRGMFLVRARGRSMEPLIPDGKWCLFRECPLGSRDRRVVLVQFHSMIDREEGGRFTIKRYRSEKTVDGEGWKHERIWLEPINGEFEPIEVTEESGREMVVVGEFVRWIEG